MKGTRALVLRHLPIALAVVPPVFPHQCQSDWPPGHSSGGAGGADTAGAAGTVVAMGGLAGSSSSGSTPPSCGNGLLDPGEVCDDGAVNGDVGQCDATCAFSCTGACPLRVDPAAAVGGSGRDWNEPTNHLQAAIDQQVARGGGEVWVRAGEYALSNITNGNAIAVGSLVALRGGFSGNETNSDQRSPDQRTRLRGAGEGSTTAVLRITAASGVVINQLELIDGEPNFEIIDSSNVLLTGLTTTTNTANPTPHSLAIVNSEVRIEQSKIFMPRNYEGLTLTSGSEVAIKNSTITSLVYTDSQGSIPRLQAHDSRLLLQGSQSLSGTVINTGAEALIVRSTLQTGQQSLGPTLSVSGSAALVDNQLGPGFGYPPIYTTGTLIVFDSVFGATRATNAHGYYPSAWAIDGSGALEVSLSSFAAGRCDYADADCEVLIPGNINNSLFAVDPSKVVVGQSMPASNCSVASSSSACTDAGDETLLAASHARLMAFAAQFLGAPFYADLSGYSDPNFWRCNDANAPNPGYHAPCNP